MLDIFTIFSKGGIVLWFFQGNSSLIPLPPVNALIKSVILQERVHQDLFNYENLSLKFKVRIGWIINDKLIGRYVIRDKKKEID